MDRPALEIHHPQDPMDLAHRLAGAVRFQTISYLDEERADPDAFRGLLNYLEQEFPRVHAELEREVVGRFSLLFRWPGSESGLRPVLLTGHMDVVPVEDSTLTAWRYPPFTGCIEEGYIWGRGTLDDKVNVIGLLEAVEALLRQNFRPARTLYLGFGEDEEVMGPRGARQIAALLASRGVQLEFVLDEGLAVTEGVVPEVSKPVAMIGIAEKGYVGIELSVEKAEGHLAMPPRETAIGILAGAVSRLEQHPLPARSDAPIFQTLDTLAPELPAYIRAALKARRLAAGLLLRQLSANEGTDSNIRSSTALTVFQAGEAVNLLAARAVAYVFFFILPGDTITSISAHVRSVVADSRVQIAVQTQNCAEASPISPVDSPGYRQIAASIRAAFPGVLVAPGLSTTPTDCHHYAGLTRNCYRFTPLWITPEDVPRLHGVNERISVQNLAQAVAFYQDLIQSFCS